MRRPRDFATHPVGFAAAQAATKYRAVCYHVVDGDTFDVFVDFGFYTYGYHTIRLRRLSAPELFSGSRAVREQGRLAKDALTNIILGQPLLLQTYRDSLTFGRFVADAWHCSPGGVEVDIAEIMAQLGQGTIV